MALAVFDIDGTLVAGRSTEKRLFLMLLRGGWLKPRQLAAFLGFALRHWPEFGRHVFKKDKAYLAGLRKAEVERVAADWVAAEAPHWWFEPCVARLRQHQAAGDDVVLLSGSPSFVAGPIAHALGVGRVEGTLCEARAGFFVASPPYVHPFSVEKLQIARDLCRALGTTPDQMVCYADSVHDLPLLRFAGRAIAVRPDTELKAAALGAGWEILGDRHAARKR